MDTSLFPIALGAELLLSKKDRQLAKEFRKVFMDSSYYKAAQLLALLLLVLKEDKTDETTMREATALLKRLREVLSRVSSERASSQDAKVSEEGAERLISGWLSSEICSTEDTTSACESRKSSDSRKKRAPKTKSTKKL